MNKQKQLTGMLVAIGGAVLIVVAFGNILLRVAIACVGLICIRNGLMLAGHLPSTRSFYAFFDKHRFW